MGKRKVAKGVFAKRSVLLLMCLFSGLSAGCDNHAASVDSTSPKTDSKAVKSQIGSDDVGMPERDRDDARTSPEAAVPGELIVKFKSTGEKRVTACAAELIESGRSFVSGTADNSSSLDGLIKKYDVREGDSFIEGRKGLSTARARTRMLSLKASLKRDIPDLTNVYLLKMSENADLEAAARELAADPHVEYAYPNYRVEAYYTPNDPYLSTAGSWGQSFDDLWGLDTMDAETAWDTSRGDGIVVAVVDTGVDTAHSDLSVNIWTNPNETQNGVDDDENGYIDDLVGWDMYNSDNDPMDDNGHGTHVAGTIAAEDNNSIGIVGVAPDAQIMVVKGLSGSGSGSSYRLSKGILYAAENGADVINNSWGCSSACPTNTLVEEAVQTARALGSTVVFAAGNNADDIENYSPQNTPHVITVGAVDPSNEIASFSNYGMIDVVAPGAGYSVSPPSYIPLYGILSLKSSELNSSKFSSNLIIDDDYLRLAGTSMAAPHVAGLAALVLEAQPTLDPEQVRQVIRVSSNDVNQDGYDAEYGWGVVSASGAVAEDAPLVASITQPLESLYDEPSTVAVEGSAYGPDFESYTLSYRKLSDTSGAWTTISTGTGTVTDGALGSWDLSVVEDGEQVLRLAAVTTDGRVYEDRRHITLDNIDIDTPEDESAISAGDIVSIEGTAAPYRFSSFDILITDSDGTEVSDADITLTGDGQSTVSDGVIATWDTASMPTGFYTLTLEITLDSGDTMTKSVSLIVDTALHSGWPRSMADSDVYTTIEHVTLADVDGDGRAEFLMAFDETLYVITADGTALSGWPQSIDPDGLGAFVQRAPAVGDIDGDGSVDIVLCNNEYQLLVFEADGTLKSGWPVEIDGIVSAVALEDMDGDGIQDIIAASFEGHVTVIKGDGTALTGFPVTLADTLLSAPAVADIDNDGSADIVVVSKTKQITVYALDNEGNALSGWPQDLNLCYSDTSAMVSNGYVEIVDLDVDGDYEVIAATHSLNEVYAFHHTGEAVDGWPIVLNDFSRITMFAVGDIDGDVFPEVVIPGEIDNDTSVLHVVDSGGNALAGWPQEVETDSTAYQFWFGFKGAALVDVDNDGLADIISSRGVEDFDAAVQFYKYDGTIIEGLARPTFHTGAYVTAMPGVADMDGDGLLEVAWIDRIGDAFVWDLSAPADAVAPWPMFQQNPARTGVLQNLDYCGNTVCGASEDCGSCPEDCGSCNCTCPDGCDSLVSASVDFSKDGVDDVCYFFEGLGDYVSSSNTAEVNLNGTDITNQWVGLSDYPGTIDGGYYLYYRAEYSWSHVESKSY